MPAPHLRGARERGSTDMIARIDDCNIFLLLFVKDWNPSREENTEWCKDGSVAKCFFLELPKLGRRRKTVALSYDFIVYIILFPPTNINPAQSRPTTSTVISSKDDECGPHITGGTFNFLSPTTCGTAPSHFGYLRRGLSWRDGLWADAGASLPKVLGLWWPPYHPDLNSRPPEYDLVTLTKHIH